MKLSIEHHHGLGKIARYYEKIESLAEHMTSHDDGTEDSLPHSRMEGRQTQMNVATRRQQVFRMYNEDHPASSIVNLNVIVNEDRF